jgi:2-polyprenyl-6-hydroxyphenyl methylase/3-demethylubiquinone-9 3-methyltransferase
LSVSADTAHANEVARGERFEFGENWKRFLAVLDEERIAEAERSLRTMLEKESLEGRTFLDVGSGSGLFSLAARRLGARVTSFDYDPKSVACTRELKRRFFADDEDSWKIEEGSVLDTGYLATLGQFDIVYSWGVLHHTGNMWKALENVAPLVKPDGQLFIAIYNDQGGASARWSAVKKMYNRAAAPLKPLIVVGIASWWEARAAAIRLAQGRNPLPFSDWARRKHERGMSPWHDFVDWVGGYPFEVSKPERMLDFFRSRGFTLDRLVTCGSGHGCNEYVLRRITRHQTEQGRR